MLTPRMPGVLPRATPLLPTAGGRPSLHCAITGLPGRQRQSPRGGERSSEPSLVPKPPQKSQLTTSSTPTRLTVL